MRLTGAIQANMGGGHALSFDPLVWLDAHFLSGELFVYGEIITIRKMAVNQNDKIGG
jgi:hypothetical protein